MEQMIPQLEQIFCDLCFTGVSDAGSDAIHQLETAHRYCHELNMKLGEMICERLKEEIIEKRTDSAALTLCRLGCYVQCLNGVQNENTEL